MAASYLLAPGHFHDRVRAAACRHRSAPLLDAGTPDPRLMELVVRRYLDGSAGGGGLGQTARSMHGRRVRLLASLVAIGGPARCAGTGRPVRTARCPVVVVPVEGSDDPPDLETQLAE